MTEPNSKPDWAQDARDRKKAAGTAQSRGSRALVMAWLIVGVLVAGTIGYLATRPASEAAAPAAPETAVVKQVRRAETITIAPAALRQTVRVTGTLAPIHQADVAAPVSAPVLEVLVRPGDRVEAGQILVRLDTRALTIALDKERATADATRAELVSAEQQLQRTEDLAAEGLATPSALEVARSTAAALRSNLDALENAVETAELAVADATLRAPISGTVSSRNLEAGQSVTAGTSVITIVDLETMELDASASVSASAQVQPGQTATLTVIGLEGQTFTGTVVRINPVAIAGTRTIPIYVTVDNPQQVLRGGMFASGVITVAEKTEAIAVPSQAIHADAEGSYVLKLQDGVVVRQAVQPGAQWNSGRSVEVAGVAVGDLIVATPLTRLGAGDHIALLED